MEAAGAVTGFAAGVTELGIGNGDLAVGRAGKMGGLVFVALGALFGANIRGSGNLGRGDHGAVHRHTGNEEQAPSGGSSENKGVLGQMRSDGHDGSWV